MEKAVVLKDSKISQQLKDLRLSKAYRFIGSTAQADGKTLKKL